MAEVAAPREIETKYAVERSFTVPPLAAAVPGIAAVDEPRTVELTASYYDTADLRLAATASPCAGGPAATMPGGTSSCPTPRTPTFGSRSAPRSARPRRVRTWSCRSR